MTENLVTNVVESGNLTPEGYITGVDVASGAGGTSIYEWWPQYQQIYWSYPVPVYEDKGKKALAIVKVLMEEKLVDIRSVKKFVELQEKIIAIL